MEIYISCVSIDARVSDALECGLSVTTPSREPAADKLPRAWVCAVNIKVISLPKLNNLGPYNSRRNIEEHPLIAIQSLNNDLIHPVPCTEGLGRPKLKLGAREPSRILDLRNGHQINELGSIQPFRNLNFLGAALLKSTELFFVSEERATRDEPSR
jgi:hypothetical protein